MNKPETDFYHELRDEIPEVISGKYHLTRIESNLTSQGIPDINFVYGGVECWIELKVGDNYLSPMQLSWQEQHRQAGGLVFTVWKKGDSDYILESNTVIAKAFSITEVVQMIIAEMMSS